ncbi:MAG: hypothetical protein V1867_03435 [Candidatus Falkowbacteria bacterium]
MLTIKKINYSHLLWLLFYLVIFSYLIFNSYNYLDADLGWHLDVGKRVLEERSVPVEELYDYTLADRTWVDHEWLLNVVTYWLYDNYGYFSVNIFFALIVVLALIILNIYTRKYFIRGPGGQILIGTIQFFGVLAMAPHLGVRMQTVTLLNLSLLLFIIRNYEITKNTRVLFWLWPLFCFWANVHAGFLIGIFMLALWLGIKSLEIILKKFRAFARINFVNERKSGELAKFLLFALGAIGATLINPYGLKLYSFLLDYSNNYYLRVIAEWLPSYSMPIQYKQLIYAALVVAMLTVFTADLARSLRKKEVATVDGWHLGMILVLLFMAAQSKRHFPLFFTVSFPWLIFSLVRDLRLPENFAKYISENTVLKIFVLPIFLLAAANFLTRAQYAPDPFFSPYFCRYYPCKAVQYMKNNPDLRDRKILNDYGWGGYMIWTWPGKKLFIDGRLPFYEFDGHSLLEEYTDFFLAGKAKDELDKHDISLVLLKLYPDIDLNWFEKKFLGLDEDEINNQKRYLREYLRGSANWELVYRDNVSEVFAEK